jgi:hypothetical protein
MYAQLSRPASRRTPHSTKANERFPKRKSLMRQTIPGDRMKMDCKFVTEHLSCSRVASNHILHSCLMRLIFLHLSQKLNAISQIMNASHGPPLIGARANDARQHVLRMMLKHVFIELRRKEAQQIRRRHLQLHATRQLFRLILSHMNNSACASTDVSCTFAKHSSIDKLSHFVKHSTSPVIAPQLWDLYVLHSKVPCVRRGT